MKYAIAFVLLAIAALLQTSVVPAFSVIGVYPNLVLVFILSWAMVRGLREAMVVVPLGTLTLGLMSGQPLGAFLLAAMPIVLLTEIREARIIEGEFLLAVLLAIISTLAYEGIFLILLRLMGETVEWWSTISRMVLPAAIVNTLLVPPVYVVLWVYSSDARRVSPL